MKKVQRLKGERGVAMVDYALLMCCCLTLAVSVGRFGQSVGDSLNDSAAIIAGATSPGEARMGSFTGGAGVSEFGGGTDQLGPSDEPGTEPQQSGGTSVCSGGDCPE